MMSKGLTRYVDKEGNSLNSKEYEKLIADEKYCTIREYSNDDYHLKVYWHGKRDINASIDYWTPYGFKAKTFVDGRWVDDPFSSKLCRTEKEAIKCYEEFLANYTDCTIKEDSAGHEKFYEVDNKLAPPPPPDPDIPLISEKTKDYAGSW